MSPFAATATFIARDSTHATRLCRSRRITVEFHRIVLSVSIACRHQTKVTRGSHRRSSFCTDNGLRVMSVSEDPVMRELRASARRLGGVAIFSAAVNLLTLAGSLYMLQVYDRVIPGRSLATLVGLSLIVLLAY